MYKSIIFPYLILHRKENFLLMDKSVNSTSLFYPIPPSSIVDPKYCVSLVLNVHIYFTAEQGNAEVVIKLITCFYPHYYHQIFLLKKHMVKHRKIWFFNYLSISMLFRTFTKNSKSYHIMKNIVIYYFISSILVYQNISNILINWNEIAFFILTHIHHLPTNYIYSFTAVVLFGIFSW